MNAFSMPPPQPAGQTAAPADIRQTPGAYLRKCRLRARVTLHQCAELIAQGPANQARAYRDLVRLECNEPGDYGQLARCLHNSGAFPFDFARFVALAAETCDASLDPDATV